MGPDIMWAEGTLGSLKLGGGGSVGWWQRGIETKGTAGTEWDGGAPP